MNTEKVKHTPGPWKFEYDYREPFAGNCHITANHNYIMQPCKMSEANARLIAEAPAMYEALKRFVELSDCQSDNYLDLSLAIGEIKSIALTTIARIEGGQSK